MLLILKASETERPSISQFPVGLEFSNLLLFLRNVVSDLILTSLQTLSYTKILVDTVQAAISEFWQKQGKAKASRQFEE